MKSLCSGFPQQQAFSPARAGLCCLGSCCTQKAEEKLRSDQDPLQFDLHQSAASQASRKRDPRRATSNISKPESRTCFVSTLCKVTLRRFNTFGSEQFIHEFRWTVTFWMCLLNRLSFTCFVFSLWFAFEQCKQAAVFCRFYIRDPRRIAYVFLWVQFVRRYL